MDVGTKQLATLWKNGEANHLLNQDSEAYAITVHNNDVYVAGTFDEEGLGTRSLYWKNNEIVELTTGARPSRAADIFVSNGDVYVAGFEDNGTNYVAQYWKNGQAIALGDGSEYSVALSIFVTDNQVHVVGVTGSVGSAVATYWKNGETIPLHSSEHAYASDIVVDKETVHIVGSGNYNEIGNPIAQYWVNGQLHKFQPAASEIHALFVR
jgi:hypothetical protein